MTLIVGLIAKDGIVLASDSRMASSEITSNEHVQKIFKLNDHYAVGVSGDGTLGIHFLNLIQEELNFESGIVKLVEQIRDLGKKQFQDYYSETDPKDRPGLTFLVAGYASKNPKPIIYELSSNDNFVPRPSPTGYGSIGIPYISDYLLSRFYQSEIDTSQAEVLAAFCIMETSTQASGVNDNIKMVSFSNTKAYTELTPQQIENIKRKCTGFHVLNKNKFYPENTSGIISPLKEEK